MRGGVAFHGSQRRYRGNLPAVRSGFSRGFHIGE